MFVLLCVLSDLDLEETLFEELLENFLQAQWKRKETNDSYSRGLEPWV